MLMQDVLLIYEEGTLSQKYRISWHFFTFIGSKDISHHEVSAWYLDFLAISDDSELNEPMI